MKKIMSGILVAGTLLMTATPAFAATGDEIGTKSDAGEATKVAKDGVTSLEITDFTVDPDTKLPSDPGAFTLETVPNIDFGSHSLASVAATNQTFEGKYVGDLTVADNRPTADSIAAALSQITSAESEGADAAAVSTSRTNWNNAIAVGAWSIKADATVLDPTGEEIGTSLKIGEQEVLGSAADIYIDEDTTADGTVTVTKDLATPVLTIANNQLTVGKTYNGIINYHAVSAE